MEGRAEWLLACKQVLLLGLRHAVPRAWGTHRCSGWWPPSLHGGDIIHWRGRWDSHWAQHCHGCNEDGQEGEKESGKKIGHAWTKEKYRIIGEQVLQCIVEKITRKLRWGSMPELWWKPDERNEVGYGWSLGISRDLGRLRGEENMKGRLSSSEGEWAKPQAAGCYLERMPGQRPNCEGLRWLNQGIWKFSISRGKL